MPSDARLSKAVDAFAALTAQFKSAVAATREELRAELTLQGLNMPDRIAQLQSELGVFAAGRIDVSRLGGLLGAKAPFAPATRERLERAAAALEEVAEHGEALMQVQVPAGGDLTAAVAARLAEIGRAFGAARVAAARNTLTTLTAQDESVLRALPFREWTAGERRLGPPLVVFVNGDDLRPAGLAEFADGLQKIVLVVEGDAPPASLVRLITPGVYVAQSSDPSVCDQVANWPEAAVAAIVPATCAEFVHDPSAGPELWQRVKVHRMPEPPTARRAGMTSAQQVEELRQLESLAHMPAAAGFTGGVGEAGVDPVDRVAAWLLRQADLTESAGGN